MERKIREGTGQESRQLNRVCTSDCCWVSPSTSGVLFLLQLVAVNRRLATATKQCILFIRGFFVYVCWLHIFPISASKP